LPRVASGAELSDQVPEGVVGVTKAFGHVLLAAAVGEDGAQGLVLPVGWRRRLEEEAVVRGVVHRQTPGVR
jgi:hypothetical protein